ncbi:MAG: hypothetical protein UX30_C0003G0137 [Candidatus Saccharibacteria bacterium GW2011_GWA2_46_10]|nr:MAG: hypothetical protein UX30_C0003G0137 [Candidatus Saccharibacteria bacterium GW2011_GWA2_46_10]
MKKQTLNDLVTRIKNLDRKKAITISVVIIAGITTAIFGLTSSGPDRNSTINDTDTKTDKSYSISAEPIIANDPQEFINELSKQIEKIDKTKIENQKLDKLWWIVYGGPVFSRAVLVPNPTVKSVDVSKHDQPDKEKTNAMIDTFVKIMKASNFTASIPTIYSDYEVAVVEFHSNTIACQLSKGATGTAILGSNDGAQKGLELIVGCVKKSDLDTSYKYQDRFLSMINNAVNSSIAVESADERISPYVYINVFFDDSRNGKLEKIRKLVRVYPDGHGDSLYETRNGRMTPCMIFDAWGASGNVYDDCIQEKDLNPDEIAYLKNIQPYANTYRAYSSNVNHDFKYSKLPSFVLNDFYPSSDVLKYKFGTKSGYEVFVYRARVNDLKYLGSSDFNLAVFYQNLSSSKYKIQYGYKTSGKYLRIVFRLDTQGDNYEGWITDNNAINSMSKIEEYLKILKSFVTEALNDLELANKISTSLPFSSIIELCNTANSNDKALGGSGHLCSS